MAQQVEIQEQIRQPSATSSADMLGSSLTGRGTLSGLIKDLERTRPLTGLVEPVVLRGDISA